MQTYIGPMLLSLNPYQKVDAYNQETLNSYMNAHLADNPAHIFGIANLVYTDLLKNKNSHSVLIKWVKCTKAKKKTNRHNFFFHKKKSGESGSGKTESVKYILQFIVNAINKKNELENTDKQKGDIHQLQQQIVSTNPILESFGNAKTVRNNNSSRFGKFVVLYFDKHTHNLVGSQIESYLLEKSRVTDQSLNERNYHVFYQLVKV